MLKYYFWDYTIMAIVGIIVATGVYNFYKYDSAIRNYENICRDHGGQPVVAFSGNNCINPASIIEVN